VQRAFHSQATFCNKVAYFDERKCEDLRANLTLHLERLLKAEEKVSQEWEGFRQHLQRQQQKDIN